MKTVGERIRQAREYRGLSGEELALKVGYSHQSGIANLENRATGRGGFKLPLIAEVLDFAVDWFLSGPDTENMKNVPSFKPQQLIGETTEIQHDVRQKQALYTTTREKAHQIIDQLSEQGIIKAIDMLMMIKEVHPRNEVGAGNNVPASGRKAA